MGSSPGWSYTYVPTAAQWNQAFADKQDDLGYTPVNRGGDSMAGPLLTFGSVTAAAGLNIGVGVAPSDPNEGDVWVTSGGLYAYVAGSTVGPIGPGSVLSVGLSAPAQFAVTGSPVTGSGTLALTWEDQLSNLVFAGPATPATDGPPTFRSLTSDDLPGTLVATDQVNVFTASQALGEGVAVASAATLTLGTDGNFFHITGTTGVTSVVSQASPFWLCFDAALTLTNNANIILPGNASITTAAGDVAEFVNEGAGIVRCVNYTRASGQAVTGLTIMPAQATTSGNTKTFGDIPSWAKRLKVLLQGVSSNGSGAFQVQIGTSGGLATTGYLGASGVANFTTCFGISSANAANVVHGCLSVELAGSDNWVAWGVFGLSNTATTITTGGSKSLGGTLTQVALVTGDTWDAGSVVVTYEG